MDIDPRGNLLRLAVIVRAGRNHRYESDRLAVDLIVRLIERYLAVYRHLFRGDADLQAALREILETFVGWPSALQLIYRLDDLSRQATSTTGLSGARSLDAAFWETTPASPDPRIY